MSNAPSLKALRELVGSRLATRKFCGITGKNLQRCWPEWSRIDAQQRDRELQSFAAREGWTVKISDSGDRLTFRRQSD